MADPTTHLDVSEIFESLQGEGASAGMPCTFLRLGRCNLTCTWCDTKYTWDWKQYDIAKELEAMPIAQVADRVQAAPRLVITGGEPLLQAAGLERLVAHLPSALPIEVETNGTLAPTNALLDRIDQWNVSPKLANSGEPERRRLVPTALDALRDTGRAWLKLVVRGDDTDEARALVERLNWPSRRVLLMPEADTPERLDAASPQVANACRSHGFRFSPRLHVQLWGGRRGT